MMSLTAIVADYPMYTTASAMVETADKLTDHGHTSGHYALLLGGLKALARGTRPVPQSDSYILRALAIAGWTPELDAGVITGEDGPHTAFVCGRVVLWTRLHRLDPHLRPESITLLTALLKGDWAVADTSPDGARIEARGIVAAYAQFHLERLDLIARTHRSDGMMVDFLPLNYTGSRLRRLQTGPRPRTRRRRHGR